jgi:hypothetical protein
MQQPPGTLAVNAGQRLAAGDKGVGLREIRSSARANSAMPATSTLAIEKYFSLP